MASSQKVAPISAVSMPRSIVGDQTRCRKLVLKSPSKAGPGRKPSPVSVRLPPPAIMPGLILSPNPQTSIPAKRGRSRR